MKAAVKDACVLIDLVNGDLLGSWFKLGIETFTTDLVVRQIRYESQWAVVSGIIDAGLLKVVSLDGNQMMNMRVELGHLPVGVEDQSVLYLALEIEAILISGDRRLRLEGTRRSVEVRGVLWLLDQLVDAKIIVPSEALIRLERMLDSGAFLPEDECSKRRQDWSIL